MKRFLSCLGLISLFTTIAVAHAANFSDVASDSWFKPYTDYLVDQEIISNNAQFFPFRTITRAELAKMAVNAGTRSDLLVLASSNNQRFCDVSASHWAAAYINTLVTAQIVNGSTSSACNLGKDFFPDRPITRAEAIKILLNLYRITPGGTQSFQDVSGDLWYSSYIAAAVQTGLVSGYTDGTFRPNHYLTRAEMSKVLVRAIDHHNGSDDDSAHPNSTATPTFTPSPTSTPIVTMSSQTHTNATIRTGSVSIYALGDSLTAGDRDETDRQGYTSRLLTKVNTIRAGSQMHNIGVSGVDSSTLVSDQLPQTLSAHPDIVTVLIGSNDMWQDGWNDTDSSASTIANYRENMDIILSRLHNAGIKVYVGLVDDQSLRPVAQGDGMGLNNIQRARMSRIATAFNQIIREKAAQYDATVVDFYSTTIFTSSATLSDDGNHPNATGYEAMANLWFAAMRNDL